MPDADKASCASHHGTSSRVFPRAPDYKYYICPKCGEWLEPERETFICFPCGYEHPRDRESELIDGLDPQQRRSL
jgi:hypothetical protein